MRCLFRTEWEAYKCASDYRAKGIQWQAKVDGLINSGPDKGFWSVTIW